MRHPISLRFLIVFLCTITWLPSCKVNYTMNQFAGGINPDIKTVSVQFFPNYAPLAQPNLSQSFTEALRDIFLSQTSLRLVQQNGDIQLEGEITGYQTAPVAVQGDERAALNRLTITVNVRYVNVKEEDKDFETAFSQFSDFDGSENLSDVEDQLIDQINQQLAQDILNKSFGDW
ncbi:MAG: LptE family protein [Bacteroidota bacterium]